MTLQQSVINKRFVLLLNLHLRDPILRLQIDPMIYDVSRYILGTVNGAYYCIIIIRNKFLC